MREARENLDSTTTAYEEARSAVLDAEKEFGEEPSVWLLRGEEDKAKDALDKAEERVKNVEEQVADGGLQVDRALEVFEGTDIALSVALANHAEAQELLEEFEAGNYSE